MGNSVSFKTAFKQVTLEGDSVQNWRIKSKYNIPEVAPSYFDYYCEVRLKNGRIFISRLPRGNKASRQDYLKALVKIFGSQTYINRVNLQWKKSFSWIKYLLLPIYGIYFK